MKKLSTWHVSIAAEAFAAGQLARCGYDVSVQYGANQPEYDLIATKGEKMLKISVKGSQDGSWGLTQSHLKNANYQEAINIWLSKHKEKTIFCLVQFKNIGINELPKIYLATPEEIAKRLSESVKGRGETILYEYHEWTKWGAGSGTTEKIPDEWKFSSERIENLFDIFYK